LKIISVVGARPNFIKIAPFCKAVDRYNESNKNKINHILLHTGQHYDKSMSENFFQDLNIPTPDINLGIGSGTHAEQVGNTMIAFERVIDLEKPDWIVVVGDVNATLACSVTAKKLNINVCHIEAGLRSNDLTMPEEINRIVTDSLSDLLLTPDILSSKNLLKEGVNKNKIVFVGNIMVDTLENNRDTASKLNLESIIVKHMLNKLKRDDFSIDEFILVTLHRPSNVDRQDILNNIVNCLNDQVSTKIPVIWTLHPRTLKQLKLYNLYEKIINNIYLLEPLSYKNMLKLNIEAKAMLTDSGGLQEECSVLGTPCLTLRYNTERPITLKENGGTCTLVGDNISKINFELESILSNKTKKMLSRPKKWDGGTADRCLNAIINYKAT